ncbi:tyrosine-type recombinase/integrase [Janthinobacterium fluminis]|uniref:Tyrosine-type recombinase/integrase n=1 Tax=Janthinobacterium fluminis TaxID=2987524 RepID=A0ABT5JUH7_9BURK|nr:tyrosine-type recombinase/integrase [Janthinobacterium fluminis]MDC8756224.1 tyrosine-type recombinase/integrase [Janthinobacterium fluminis]
MGRSRLAKNKGFPPNLYQNSAGYFYYVDPDRGEKRTKGMGRDKAAAFREARAANAVVATRAPSSLVDWVSGKQDYTLAEWLPLYKELWLKKSTPALATLRNTSGYLGRIAESDFAWRKLTEVTTAHVAAWLDTAREERGAATSLHLRSRLSDVFRMAETQGLVEVGRNPAAATYTPDRTVKRERLTLEQFNAIRAAAPAWLQRAMNLALLTAQRRDDIAQMKFADCKDGYLYIVQGKMKGDVRLQQDVNIKLDAVNLSIGDAVANCRDLIVSRYMIHHVAKTGPAKPGDRVNANGLTQAFQVARDKVGIKAADGRTPPTFHEIRSLSERLYREQYGAEFAQAILGHKNAKTTSKYDDLRGSGWQVVGVK